MNEPEYRRMFEAEDRHWWYRTLRDLAVRYVRAEFHRRGPLRIFDAGCGTGGTMARLAPFGQVEGCDRAPAALAACRQRGQTGARAADLTELELPAEHYDAITVLDVLYHQWLTDEADLLRRLYGALRPGGLLLVNEVAFESLRSPHDEAVMTRHRYRRPELRCLLEAAGFRIERITYRLALLFLPIALVRALRRRAVPRAAGDLPASDVWLPPAPLNAMLGLVGRVDNALVRTTGLPFGTSVFAIARRPGPSK